MTRAVGVRSGKVALLVIAFTGASHAADLLQGGRELSVGIGSVPYRGHVTEISGRATIVDGHTLWFPQNGLEVRLASIDTCELPQWSFDARRHGENAILKPVPCGPLAKAWLKRSVGHARVNCVVQGHDGDGVPRGRCTVNGRDLALEMVLVGWARATGQAPAHYLAWQKHAMSARYGMWATYVLDMDEWRAKAADRTLSRQPIADFNLLAERGLEISPPFEDARRHPRRTDR